MTSKNLLHPGKGRIVRSFNRAITSEEMVRITSWHTMAEKRPEHEQKVNFQLIEDRYSGPIETGVYNTVTGFIHNDEKGMFFSTPEHTYWMPAEKPKGLFADLIAEHPGLADEMKAMDELTDERILELAHRIATKYTHRSDPTYCSYGFVKHTMIDFARAIEKEIRG